MRNSKSGITFVFGVTIFILVILLAQIFSICSYFHKSASDVATLTNPMYSAAIPTSDFSSGPDTDEVKSFVSVNSEDYVCENRDELFMTVRTNMLARITDFTVEYTGKSPQSALTTDTFQSFLNDIFSYDDSSDPADFDYLKISWVKAQLKVSTNQKSTNFLFSFSYLTTLENENAIDSEIQKIISVLDMGNDDYNKIKAINSFITAHVAFDSSCQSKSAYDALFFGKTVCRGYVLLAYKMLEAAGVPVRIIAGTAYDKPHVWNIVKINDYWYNLDITWNDTCNSDKYFLISDGELDHHEKNAEYQSEEFTRQYPLSLVSYKEISQ